MTYLKTLLPIGYLLSIICLVYNNVSVFGYELNNNYTYIFGLISFILTLKYKPSYSFSLFLIFLCSNILEHKFNFIQAPEITSILIALFIIFLFLDLKKTDKLFYILALVFFIALSIRSFNVLSNDSLLVSDDHTSFFYRLKLLSRNITNFPFYNPFWNAGWDNRDFLATGSLSFFIFFLPFHLLIDSILSYNYTVLFISTILAPLSIFLTSKLLNLNFKASLISSILTLSSGLLFYKWAFKYGTMGFIISCCLFPLVFALSIKFYQKKLTKLTSYIYIISTVLMSFWAPSLITLVPIAVFFLFTIHKWISIKNIFISFIILLCISTFIFSLFKISKVTNLVSNNQTMVFDNLMNLEEIKFKDSSELTFDNFKKNIINNFTSTNPIIWILLLPGFFIKDLPHKKLIYSTILWLFLIGTILPGYKSQLELDRMLIFMTFLAIIPIGHLLAKEDDLLSKSALNTLLITSLISTLLIFKNESWDKFDFEKLSSKKLVTDLINLKPSGRILFSGFIQHKFSGGHIALLPELTNLQLIASSPYHNIWNYTQVFPKEVISKEKDGIKTYLENLNIEYVLAHEDVWIKTFNSYDFLEQTSTSGIFKIYKVKNFVSNYFLSGAGSIVKIQENKVIFNLDSESATLKFRYFKYLTVPNCTISFEKYPGLSLVKIDKCNNKTNLELKFISPIERILHE